MKTLDLSKIKIDDLKKEIEKVNLKKIGSNFQNKSLYNFDEILPELKNNSDLQKKFRSKFRRIRNRLFNEFLQNIRKNENIADSTKKVLTFYKTFYLTNDFSLSSLIDIEKTSNQDNKIIFEKALNILKKIVSNNPEYFSELKKDFAILPETKLLIETLKKLAK